MGVKDIDILVRYKDYNKIKKIFFNFEIVDDKELTNREGAEIRYLIDGVEVQFCLEYENGFYIKRLDNKFGQNNLINLELSSAKIYCFRLEDELEGYKFLKRKEKVKIIHNFLMNENSRSNK